jgi:alkaline phosphatase D
MYETIRSARPDFFIHTGDTIYADSPVLPEVRLADGTIWKNVTTPAKSKVAETLNEFRGNYTYNMLDEHVRRFNAEIPAIVLWDDHEVRNNWYPGMSLEADTRYREKRPDVLIANARRALLEHSPIRLSAAATPPIYRSCSYGPLLDVFAIDLRTNRGPNTANTQPTAGSDTAHAGAQQLTWLKSALRSSRATWKIIASDLPIGLIVRDGPTTFEAIANADAGPPLGRELEIADLLRFLKQQRILNVVWVTGDVHYAAAHHYDPLRAQFKEFDPFWEFVGGPLHAGTFGPNELDGTFGPEVRFSSARPGDPPNRPPSDGQQFFGFARIASKTRVMTVELRNLAGETIYEVDLPAEQ